MAGPSAVRSMRAPRSIASDRQKVPDVELGVHELHPSTQIAQLLEGRIQIGFLASFIGSPAWKLQAELDAIRLMEWPLRVALRSDHPLAQRSQIPRGALADEPFILYVGSNLEQDRALIQLTLGFAPRDSPQMAYWVCDPCLGKVTRDIDILWCADSCPG